MHSKIIYKLFLVDYILVKNLDHDINKNDQEYIFYKMHKVLNSSKIRLTNYKLIHHALTTNSKFKNRYDNKSFIWNKVINESLDHIYVTCEVTKKTMSI